MFASATGSDAGVMTAGKRPPPESGHDCCGGSDPQPGGYVVAAHRANDVRMPQDDQVVSGARHPDVHPFPGAVLHLSLVHAEHDCLALEALAAQDVVVDADQSAVAARMRSRTRAYAASPSRNGDATRIRGGCPIRGVTRSRRASLKARWR